MELGEVLRAVRLRARLSQEELAARLFINQSDVSKIENNRKIPDAITFIRWFKAAEAPEICAAMLCGIDPNTLTEFVQQVMTFSQLVGSFVYLMLSIM